MVAAEGGHRGYPKLSAPPRLCESLPASAARPQTPAQKSTDFTTEIGRALC